MTSATQSFGGAVLLIFVSAQAQNLFVSDYSGNIFQFTQGGARSTFASGTSNPQGLAFNNQGDLFEADNGSGNIYEFTPGGTQSTFATGLSYPLGLAFDNSGNLFEADAGSGQIIEFTAGGMQSTFASGLNSPTSLAFNGAGDLFVSNYGGSDILEFTPSGMETTFASVIDPRGLAFNSAGNLFVVSLDSIYAYTPGRLRSTYASALTTPDGLAFNQAGNLFVSEQVAGEVLEITPSRTKSIFASGLGVSGNGPDFLTFRVEETPEPSVVWLLLMSAAGFLIKWNFKVAN